MIGRCPGASASGCVSACVFPTRGWRGGGGKGCGTSRHWTCAAATAGAFTSAATSLTRGCHRKKNTASRSETQCTSYARYARSLTHAHAHIDIHTPTGTHSRAHTYRNTHTYPGSHTGTPSRIYKGTRTHKCTHTNGCAHTIVCVHTHAHAHTDANRQTHTRIHTREPQPRDRAGPAGARCWRGLDGTGRYRRELEHAQRDLAAHLALQQRRSAGAVRPST